MFKNDIVVLNMKLCMPMSSYLTITKNLYVLRCQVCEVSLTERVVDQHVNTAAHENAMGDTIVIQSLAGEFVREVSFRTVHF